MSKISGQFQDICEISGISGQLGALRFSIFMSICAGKYVTEDKSKTDTTKTTVLGTTKHHIGNEVSLAKLTLVIKTRQDNVHCQYLTVLSERINTTELTYRQTHSNSRSFVVNLTL